jgi:hypothetical protein
LKRDIIIYGRESEKSEFIVIINFGDKPYKFRLDTKFNGSYIDLLDEEHYNSSGGIKGFSIKPLEVKIIFYKGD